MRDITFYKGDSLNFILKALESGLDTSFFVKERFDSSQVEEIYYGLKLGVDVSKYANKKYDSLCMKYIREGLMMGIDISKYSNPKFSCGKMMEIRDSILSNSYIDEFSMENVGESTVRICSKMILEGIDKELVQILIRRNYSPTVISKVREINFIYGKQYNDLFKKYDLSESFFDMTIDIIKSNTISMNEDILEFFLDIQDSIKKYQTIGILRKALEIGKSIDDCRKFLAGHIESEELLLEPPINKEKVYSFLISNYLKETFKSAPEEKFVSILVKAKLLDINIKDLIENSYSYEQIEEICHAVEDCGLEVLQTIDAKMTPIDIFLKKSQWMFNMAFIDECKKKGISTRNTYWLQCDFKLSFSNESDMWSLEYKKTPIKKTSNIKDIVKIVPIIVSSILDGLDGEELSIVLSES